MTQRRERRGVDADVDLDEHKRGASEPTGHVSSGLQGGPMRRDETKAIGPAPTAEQVGPTGRDDLIPVRESVDEAKRRSALRTPRQAGLEAEDEDEGR